VVNYGYDTAGRLNSFTGKLGGITGPGGADVNYATGIQYNSYGLTSRETYNGMTTPLYLNLHYNNRLQMVDLRLGDSSTDEWNWARGALVFYYGTNAVNGWNPFANSTDNNGNVLRHVNYVPLSGGGSVVPQLDDYSYDSLNRITSVSEQQQSQGGQWTFVFTQAFSYDRWGNRTINVPGTTPSIPGVTRKTFVVDTATNRLTSSDGCTMTYDAAGNQTYDCVGTHSYDSENRMTKAVQGGSNNYYFYDANGKRVQRILNGSQTWGGQETWFVYGFDGELVAEYTYNQVTAPLPTAPQKEYGYRGGKMLVVWDGDKSGDERLKWLVTDHLGSTRMEADKSGRLDDDLVTSGVLEGIRRHDYLPFGEELVASTGAQRSGVGYEPPASNVKNRFGSKEYDNETGLNFFEARYYASVQGRFTSVDPFNPIFETRGAEFIEWIGEPQRWNKYSYALNNPLKYIDEDGENPEAIKRGARNLAKLSAKIAQRQAGRITNPVVMAAETIALALELAFPSIHVDLNGLKLEHELVDARLAAAFEGKNFWGVLKQNAEGIDGILYNGPLSVMLDPEGIQLYHNTTGSEQTVRDVIAAKGVGLDKSMGKGVIKEPIHIFAVVANQNVTLSGMVNLIQKDAGAGTGILATSKRSSVSKITIVLRDGVIRAQNGKLFTCGGNGTDCKEVKIQ
jgi:RHS repeat-associated protein